MVKKINEKDNGDFVKKIARDYVLAKPMDILRSRNLEEAGASFKHYLQTFGITSDIYTQFVDEVAQLRGDYKGLAKELAVDISKIRVFEDDSKTFSLDELLTTKDRVLIAPFPIYTTTEKGQFLTGFDSEKEAFIFSAESKYRGHLRLNAETLQGCGIVEGGFIRINPSRRSIVLFGESDTYHVYPGNISSNLLRRALPDWEVKLF